MTAWQGIFVLGSGEFVCSSKGITLLLVNRPINDLGQRVTPEALVSYRASGFRRPCCLCAVPGRDGTSPGYTESTVVIGVGEHSGEFTIACAEGKCAYQGEINS